MHFLWYRRTEAELQRAARRALHPGAQPSTAYLRKAPRRRGRRACTGGGARPAASPNARIPGRASPRPPAAAPAPSPAAWRTSVESPARCTQSQIKKQWAVPPDLFTSVSSNPMNKNFLNSHKLLFISRRLGSGGSLSNFFIDLDYIRLRFYMMMMMMMMMRVIR